MTLDREQQPETKNPPPKDENEQLVTLLHAEYQRTRTELLGYLGFIAKSVPILTAFLIGIIGLEKQMPGVLVLVPPAVVSWFAMVILVYSYVIMTGEYSEKLEEKLNSLVPTPIFQFEHFYVSPKFGRDYLPFIPLWVLIATMPAATVFFLYLRRTLAPAVVTVACSGLLVITIGMLFAIRILRRKMNADLARVLRIPAKANTMLAPRTVELLNGDHLMPITSERHPIWNVYDTRRTARLNRKYYAARLASTERWNFCLEGLLLCTAPSSAVAGLWFWNTTVGHAAWQYLAIAAAVTAVIKPLAGLTRKIKEYEALIVGYTSIDNDLQELSIRVEEGGNYSKQLKDEFRKILRRNSKLATRYIEAHEDKKLKERCQREVTSELPANNFFVPEEE